MPCGISTPREIPQLAESVLFEQLAGRTHGSGAAAIVIETEAVHESLDRRYEKRVSSGGVDDDGWILVGDRLCGQEIPPPRSPFFFFRTFLLLFAVFFFGHGSRSCCSSLVYFSSFPPP
jgi:hypothetical protein